MANQANLDATLAAIEAHPEHWDQTKWHCGTSHCFAGFAEMLRLGRTVCDPCNDGRLLSRNTGHRELVDECATREWLGLCDEDYYVLTDCGNTLDDLQRMVRGGDYSERDDDDY